MLAQPGGTEMLGHQLSNYGADGFNPLPGFLRYFDRYCRFDVACVATGEDDGDHSQSKVRRALDAASPRHIEVTAIS
jgi:hypothetical protein